jgi:hypothetical protein
MGSEFTPFGDDVKRLSSPESVPQKVPDAVPNFSLGIHVLMDREWLEVWLPRLGVYAELLADSEFQGIGKGKLAKVTKRQSPGR